MDKAKLGALLISIFFVGSIIGYGFIYNLPQVGQEPTDQLPNLDPTQISMQASRVQADIVLMLPKIRLIAETEELNINTINSNIYAVQGVKGVSSLFQQVDSPEVATGLLYIADVQISSGEQAEEVFSNIQESVSFERLDGFAYALLAVPEEIEFSRTDLNISKTASLRRNESEALVYFGAKKGDPVKINIEATFLGTEITNVLAYEVKNVFLLAFDVSYAQTSLLDSLEAELSLIEGVLELELSEPYLEAKLLLSKEGAPLPTEVVSDLNAFIQTLSDDTIFYNESFFSASLFFEDGTDLVPIKAQLDEKLGELLLSDVSLSESKGQVSGSFILESDDSSKVGEMEALLEQKGFENISIVQFE